MTKLYCNPNISKAAIQDIIQNTKELFNSDFLDILKQIHITSNNSYDNDFNKVIEALSNPFSNLETHYQREKNLENTGFLIRPSKFLIGSEEYPQKNSQCYDSKCKRCNRNSHST